ncbi:MAG: hypothetical protein ACRECN_05230, partial [Methylocella sp.]
AWREEMWFGGSIPKMANRAWLHWNGFTAEDRAVLAQLNQYAIRCPQFVSKYKLEFHRLGPTVQQI